MSNTEPTIKQSLTVRGTPSSGLDDSPCPADMVNHPPHYTTHPSGVECIQITEHMGFCLGNAMKYIWRADEKGKAVEDLEKARWYLEREIQRRSAGQNAELSGGDRERENDSPENTL